MTIKRLSYKWTHKSYTYQLMDMKSSEYFIHLILKKAHMNVIHFQLVSTNGHKVISFCQLFVYHPKDGEGNVFKGGTPVTGSFPGLGSQALSQGYPSPKLFSRSLVSCPFLGGTPVQGSFPGLWSQVLSWGGYPSPDWADPRTGVSPSQDRIGVPPQNRTAKQVLATRWVVCLLRSYRRTFLFY